MFGDRDRVDLDERVPQGICIAQSCHRLAIAQMRMRIHEADLAAEIGRRFGPPEDAFRPASIGDRPVHQPRAIGKEQVPADDVEVVLRLFFGEQPAEDATFHRQQRVAEAGALVARVEQEFGPVVAWFEDRISRDGAVRDEVAVEVSAHLLCQNVEG